MKKSLKMMLAIFAFAFVALIATGTESEAATVALKQVDAGTSSVGLAWGYIGTEVQVQVYSAVTGQWIADGETNSTSYKIYGLASKTRYNVRLAWAGGVSETITVLTAPTDSDAKVPSLTQASATANSFTITWGAVAGATSYEVYRTTGLYNYTKIGTTTGRAFTVKGLPQGYAGDYFVYAKFASPNGYVTAGDPEWAGYFCKIECKTLPTKVAAVAVNNYWSYSKTADFIWSQVTNADGYQIETRNAKNKVVSKTTTTSTSASAKPFKGGQFYKTRVRAYVQAGAKKFYGPWSSYSYNATSKKVTWTRSANRKKIKLKWKKISGCAGYKVMISTKRDSGYKTVKTYGKKTKGCTIKKCGKKKLSKKKTYYVKVYYLKKVGKKKVKSGIVSLGTCY